MNKKFLTFTYQHALVSRSWRLKGLNEAKIYYGIDQRRQLRPCCFA